MARPDPERTRRIVGAVLYLLGVAFGTTSLVILFIVLLPDSIDPGTYYEAMGIGALLALPALAVYVWVPWLVDRFDPEPWWALLLVLVWGGLAACGFAALVNSGVDYVASAIGGDDFGKFMAACVSAPFVEEASKGLAVFGVFYFLRREFDGVVDGVIYATFAALGFAAVENITYYAHAAIQDTAHQGALAATFVLRGVFAPWGHPLYTSMTGLGFGISREAEKTWVRWLAPIGGYLCAVVLHWIWNTSATISGMLLFVMLPLWLIFVAVFFGIVVWLVRRKGRIIRMHLHDEVLLGNITAQELDLICSPVARVRATFGWGGAAGRRFVRAAARLGLCKWHAGRAMKGRRKTVSVDWIVPLRQELFELRWEMARAMGHHLPEPQAWQAPPPQARPPHPQAQWQGQRRWW
jgi:RsiW-degrading membrane proteinase PrsW (M82 family)